MRARAPRCLAQIVLAVTVSMSVAEFAAIQGLSAADHCDDRGRRQRGPRGDDEPGLADPRGCREEQRRQLGLVAELSQEHGDERGQVRFHGDTVHRARSVVPTVSPAAVVQPTAPLAPGIR